MAVDGYGGHGDPQRGDGDPESIREFAQWLDSSVAKVNEECAAMLNGMVLSSAAGFVGVPGDGFRDRMTAGVDHMYDLATAIRTSADDIFAAASTLEDAQREIDIAWETAHDPENYLEVVKGKVQQPPAMPPPGLHRIPVMERTAEERARAHEAFERVQQRVRRARELVNNQKQQAGGANSLGQTLFFATGDFVKGTAQQIADHFAGKEFQVALKHYDNFVAADRLKAWSRELSGGALDEILDRAKQGEINKQMNALNRFHSWGVVGKAARWTVRGLVVVGVVIDYINGDPIPKIAVKTASGLGGGWAGGLIGGGVGFLLGGPIGLAAGAVVGSVGGGVGGAAAGAWLYEAVLDDMGPVPIDETWCVPEVKS